MNNIKDILNTVICADALAVLKTLPDNSVNCVITDPPYLQDSHGGGGAFGNKKREYHNEVDKLGFGYDNQWLEEVVRVCKKLNAYIFCNKNQILQLLTFFKDYKYDILVYIKTNPTPTCNNKYLSDIEYIIYVRESGVKLLGDYHSKKKWFLQNNAKSKFEHPTIKPLNIIKTLILNSSKKDDIILDCFAGSFTTAVAAKELHRNWICIEKEEKYCRIGRNRLRQEYFNF